MANDQRRYQVLEVLGRGGFGTVYRARMEADDFQKLVAIKLLHDDVVNREVLQRFRDEARILGLLRDRAILQVDAPVLLNGRWAVVMELVDGASLARVLKRTGPLPARAAIEIIAEIARGLDRAVNQPGPDGEPLALIHRDLKPGNIQLTGGGEVKLLDFGNARARFAQRESHTTSGIVGTPGYVAPERFDGVEDPRGDVFSLGGVLHKLVAGELPGTPTAQPAPDDDLTQAAIELSKRMRNPELDERMTAREVETAANELLESATGPRLREWAEQHVPQRSRSRPDELVGTTLTITQSESVSPITPDDMLRPPGPLPVEPPAPKPWGRALVGGVGVISLGTVLLCAGGLGLTYALARLTASDLPGDTTAVADPPPEPAVPDPPAPAEPAPEQPEPEPPEPGQPGPGEPEPEDPGTDVEPAVAAPTPTPVPEAPGPRPEPAPVPVAAPTPAPAAPEPAPEPVEATSNAPVETFQVRFASTPFGLPVVVDGVTIKGAPADVILTAGTHEVQVGEHQRTIEVGPRLPKRYVVDAQDGRWQPFY